MQAIFDVAQLIDAGTEIPPTDGPGQGADYNYSQSVNFTDMSGFVADFAAGASGADINNDGVVDAQDFAVFASRSVRPRGDMERQRGYARGAELR